MNKLIIHLVNEKQLEIKNNYMFLENYLNQLNNGNLYIQIKNYIIPKSSINYIECLEEEKEEE